MVVLHLVCLVLSFFIFETNKLLFMAAEVLLICSVVLFLNLYKQLIMPLSFLKQGINAIKDQDFNVKFIPTGTKDVDELIDVYNKMIDELRSERTRQQEQHFFLEKLIQTSPTGILVLDYDRQIKQINPKAKEILSADPEHLLKLMKDTQIGNSKIIKIDGLHSYKIQKSRFIDQGFEREFIMMEEVTAELFEAEKNVYSKVIRMMAHEVNNTVGPVNSIMQMAIQHEAAWKTENDLMLRNALEVATERNQNLNIFMRNFADLVKLPRANRQKIDLVSLLQSIAELTRFSALDRQAIIELDLPDQPYLILADAQQMEQALINILKNALEALSDNGKINIILKKDQLIVRDNGQGISLEEADHLFSPFFSTKKDGQGIGLTLVREILLNHNYDFSLRTVGPGQTEFVIDLRSL